MYLNLGEGVIIEEENILGIFDLDSTTISKYGKEYLNFMEKHGKIITVSQKLPKSCILCLKNSKSILYISPLSVSTLVKHKKYN